MGRVSPQKESKRRGGNLKSAKRRKFDRTRRGGEPEKIEMEPEPQNVPERQE